jgi:hypothetical protein
MCRIAGRAHVMKPPCITPILKDIVQSGISACDGVSFSEHATCPACGGTLTGYDTRKKQFAHLSYDDGEKTVSVSVKRFRCSTCHRIGYADEPFYPATRIGSVVIDLCIALSITMPVYRVAATLAAMGIVVHRSSCRLYVQNNSSNFVRNNVRFFETRNIFGVHLPLSIIELSAIASGSAEEGRIDGSDILAACGYPSGQRTAMKHQFPLKRWSRPDDPGY